MPPAIKKSAFCTQNHNYNPDYYSGMNVQNTILHDTRNTYYMHLHGMYSTQVNPSR